MGYTIYGKVDTLEEYENTLEKYEKLKISNSSLFTPKPKSVVYIGNENYKTILPVDQHFNWFQKLMWKWCFGVEVKDYSEE